jgi:Plasmid pRiA4b ORF-3-like protein
VSAEVTTTQHPVWQELNAVQIHVVLDDIEPPVWRRLVVSLDTTLAELHHILQAAMGWTDSHLHDFQVGGLTYGDIELLSAERDDDDARVYDANEVRMRDFSREPGTSFKYVYDYGDNWRHTVTLEKFLGVKPVPKTAACIEGARCCPPEDVGGTSGYFEFLRVLLVPDPDEIEEQRHLKRWSGGKFDPERFDLAKTDKAVRGALRKRRRE